MPGVLNDGGVHVRSSSRDGGIFPGASMSFHLFDMQDVGKSVWFFAGSVRDMYKG